MKFVFLILLVIHAFIHTLGFRQAFNLISVHQFTRPISKGNGIIWLTSAVLFLAVALLLVFKIDLWWMTSLFGIATSQYLIVTAWRDAKYGTIVNVLIFAITIIGCRTWN